ncbi:MAG: 2Fe-2S iron-sulfur cluster binding domain-containing protein [Saprospirales bacterium]|nr:2Fe-2S iron-sulfur cluster binding domain-containing protein [Saprospirales bacterium]
MHTQFYSLTVSEVRRETPDAVSIFFDIPENLKETFHYTQGQHLTLKFTLGGAEVRRPYSMSSSPLEGRISVTVKKVEKGLVSTYINDKLKAGDVVDVLSPDGRFFTLLKEDQRKSYYLIGAGSGITPLLSIIKTTLELEPQSTIFLLYGNRNEDSIIFRDELTQLQKRYEGQLVVEHTLSRPTREKAKGLSGLFSKGTVSWDGRVGRIDGAMIASFLEAHPARSRESEYFLCGPGEMIELAKEKLVSLGVDSKHIHQEYFTTAELDESERASGVAGAKAIVTLNGRQFEVSIPEKKTILAALLDQKVDAPFSCTSGACSTCMAKLEKGSVKMDVCYALDEDEVAEGYILTCQSHPTTEEVVLTYDV